MKKIIVFIAWIWIIVPAAFSQSFSLQNDGDTLQMGRLNLSYNFSAKVENTTNQTTSYRAEIVNIQLPTSWEVSYCTPAACYPPGITNTTFSLDANGQGAITTEFHVGNIAGTGVATLKVTDLNTSEVQEITYYVTVGSYLVEFFDTTTVVELNGYKRLFFDIYNNESSSIGLKMFLSDVQMPADWDVKIYSSNGVVDATDTATMTISATNFALGGIDFYTGATSDSGTAILNIINPVDSLVFVQPFKVFSAQATQTTSVSSDRNIIYPNPFSGEFNISPGVYVNVYDAAGKYIERTTIRAGSNYAKGVYFVVPESREGKIVKVVKE